MDRSRSDLDSSCVAFLKNLASSFRRSENHDNLGVNEIQILPPFRIINHKARKKRCIELYSYLYMYMYTFEIIWILVFVVYPPI